MQHNIIRIAVLGLVLTFVAVRADAQTARRDHIAELLAQTSPQPRTQPDDAAVAPKPDAATPAVEPSDPRAGDPAFEQARALMQAIDAILRDTAENRAEAKKLPGKNDFIVSPMWTETREDRETKIGSLLDFSPWHRDRCARRRSSKKDRRLAHQHSRS